MKKAFFRLINYAVLKYHGVVFAEMPECNGILRIRNRGKIYLGKGVCFNSSLMSNSMGLYKPCTLVTYKDGVIHIGNNSGFSGVSIVSKKSIEIGSNVMVGGNVHIWDTDFHPLDPIKRRQNLNKDIRNSKVIIENDVWIGANTLVLKGVRIGQNSVIAAGSVVSKSIPKDEIWGSHTLKRIRPKW
jgi:acetyltransferase-like isoleucine patch superfamily enzyme